MPVFFGFVTMGVALVLVQYSSILQAYFVFVEFVTAQLVRVITVVRLPVYLMKD